MSSVSAKSVIKYAVMPQLLPRLKRLFSSSFGMIAYLLANIYVMVRLLPRDHVYLNPSNIGRFGVRHVVAEAASHLEFKPAYWDKITVFVILLSGIVMFFAQIFLVVGALIFDPVWAADVSLTNIFSTPDPVSEDALYSTDIAFSLLDRVFGIPSFFCTEFEYCTNILGASPSPFHAAMHSMFKFYSLGLMSVAVLIFLYFVVVVVGETVTTGTPFGERFKNIWVPIRLVFALLLLTPVSYGLNSGQYLALWTAKAGSGFATNGWHAFNNALKDHMGDDYNPLGERGQLVALPTTPDITPLVQAMLMVHGCAYAQWRTDDTLNSDQSYKYSSPEGETNLDDNITVPPTTQADVDSGGGFYIRPYLYMTGYPEDVLTETSFGDALLFYNHQNVTIYFGKLLEDGTVDPVCGKIEIPVTDRSYMNALTDPQSATADEINDAIKNYSIGAAIQAYYFDLIKQMWFGPTDSSQSSSSDALLIRHIAQRFVEKNFPFGDNEAESLACKIGCAQSAQLLPSCTEEFNSIKEGDEGLNGKKKCLALGTISGYALNKAAAYYAAGLPAIIEEARDNFIDNGQQILITSEVLDHGWAGAGIWYNTVGQVNGSFVSAVQALPKMVAYPKIMETVAEYNRKNFAGLSGFAVYNPAGSANKEEKNHAYSFPEGDASKNSAHALFKLLTFITANRFSFVIDTASGLTGNAFLDTVNFIFGTKGLADIRAANASIHPIAQLSAVGKGIVDSAVRNIGLSLGLSLGGGLIQSISGAIGSGVQLANELFSATAFVGLTAGVVLYYVIPILPFVFFFFAVSGWVKGLFEAMVGVPLWALAHLRIDGEGLPGDAASSGYFLIFEIFIRPILIVFGLIASMLIFGMQVRLLNVIWDLVLDNVGGATGELQAVEDSGDGMTYFSMSRGQIDQFFFTIIYTIIVYMMATASFKLIDMVPDNIMRWMGAGVKAFGDADKNPSEGLMRYAAQGGMVQGQRIVASGQKTATSLGDLLTPSPPNVPKLGK